MDEVVADTVLGLMGSLVSTEHPPAAAGRKPAQLLHVDVDHLGRSIQARRLHP